MAVLWCHLSSLVVAIVVPMRRRVCARLWQTNHTFRDVGSEKCKLIEIDPSVWMVVVRLQHAPSCVARQIEAAMTESSSKLKFLQEPVAITIVIIECLTHLIRDATLH